jgi:hypothetical protein
LLYCATHALRHFDATLRILRQNINKQTAGAVRARAHARDASDIPITVGSNAPIWFFLYWIAGNQP